MFKSKSPTLQASLTHCFDHSVFYVSIVLTNGTYFYVHASLINSSKCFMFFSLKLLILTLSQTEGYSAHNDLKCYLNEPPFIITCVFYFVTEVKKQHTRTSFKYVPQESQKSVVNYFYIKKTQNEMFHHQITGSNRKSC